MPKIIDIDNSKVAIADDGNKVIRVPIAAVQYSNPKVGDQVSVYQDGRQKFVRLDRNTPTGARSINKHLFVWLGCFFFGWVGADRHMRGQHGLGILKLAVTTIIPLAFVIAFFVSLFSSPFYPGAIQTTHYGHLNDCDRDYWTQHDNEYYDEYWYYYDDYDDCSVDDYGQYFSYEPFYEDELIALIFFLLVPMMTVSFAGGIWCLVDWIIALVKVYGSGNNSNEISFDERGHYLS